MFRMWQIAELILLLNFSQGTLAHGDVTNTYLQSCNDSRLIHGAFDNSTGARLWASCADLTATAPIHTVIDLADCLARFRAQKTNSPQEIEKDVEAVKNCPTKTMIFHSDATVTHLDVPCGSFKNSEFKNLEISEFLWFKNNVIGCFDVSGRLAEPGENIEVTGNATRRWTSRYALPGQ